MKRCPITYEAIDDEELYSRSGLNTLSRQLTGLGRLPLTAKEQRLEASARADKMSIQGVQPKLGAVLKIKEGRFDIVDINGRYILKPQSDYEDVPQNEALTMTMASTIDIEVPVHGLLYSKDGSFTYFIKRFDRAGKKQKLPLEDFAQLSGATRETKYESSMEKVATIIDRFCTFPMIEHAKLFKLTLFYFLTGNEDMHLKNFSLITRHGKVELSPAYDLLNSTIVLPNPQEELALPLNGKKSRLKPRDFIDYFAIQRLGLTQPTIDDVLATLSASISPWKNLIDISFLSDHMKDKYRSILIDRAHTLSL